MLLALRLTNDPPAETMNAVGTYNVMGLPLLPPKFITVPLPNTNTVLLPPVASMPNVFVLPLL